MSSNSRAQGDLTLLRIIDANINRAMEGLRVCEEVARFALKDVRLTRQCQRLRYDLKNLVNHAHLKNSIDVRDSKTDVGRPRLRGDVSTHRTYYDLTKANAQRVQEALRVLEEFTRLLSQDLSHQFSLLRFRGYTLEKDLCAGLQKTAPLRHR